jgi:hypothetical protein
VGQPAERRAEHVAAAVLLRTGPAAGYAVLAVSVLSAVLVPAGLWRPAVVVPVLLPAAAVVWRLTRRVPARGARPVPVWAAAACVLIAVGFGIWAGATHGEHIVLRRDAGSYALFAHWLATRNGLPVNADLAAFGGPAALTVPGFTFDSPAFYQVLGGSGAQATAQVVPQFLLGAPALYAVGWWLAGWTGLFVTPAVVSGFAILAAGGLAARLVGPRWAPPAALALALTQPMLHAARATFSEPVALLLVLAGGSLAADAFDPWSAGGAPRPVRDVRGLAIAAGGALGLAGLVRIDAVREVALVIPICALLWLRRHPAAVPMACSALVGALLAAVPAVLWSQPYLQTVAGSLRPLVFGTVLLTVASLLLVLAVRRHRGRRTPAPPPAPDGVGSRRAGVTRVLAAAAAGSVLLVGVGLAGRPLWTVTRQSPGDPGNALVASLQAQQGLPVDGARTYAERSVEWLLWYTGPVTASAALLAAAGLAAVAVHRWRRAGPVPNWIVTAWVALGSVLLTLYRPGITPDHPWADRRLVPVVLPAVVLAAAAAIAAVVRLVRRRAPVDRAGPTAAGLGSAAVIVVAWVAVLLPAAAATEPLARLRTELGEPAAVGQVCAAFRPDDVVIAVGDAGGGVRAQNEWVQVVRGVCGHPAAALRGSTAQQAAALPRLAGLVAGAGRRLVVLAAGEDDAAVSGALRGFGLHPVRAVLRRTYEDQHLLVRRPFGLTRLTIDVWLAPWPGGDAR